MEYEDELPPYGCLIPYKEDESHETVWYDVLDQKGLHPFSIGYDGTIYNLFSDYPHKMRPEEISIFDRENPYWANFFSDRRE